MTLTPDLSLPGRRTPAALKSEFLLDPDVVFLNHGSFGACPRPVFDEYQRLQRELERQPVDFLGRRIRGLMAAARQSLAEYVGVHADDLVYFPNPTTAVNMVARSLHLGPGDEVLTTDHEYGACDRTWRFLAGQAGFAYVRRPVPLPLSTAADFVEHFWRGVTARTRVIFISHITSATALRFPIEAICQRARAAGILTVIDGAHAPGQLSLDLTALDADVYVGACHKWLCAPKGSAFLYARREVQARLEPLVVSWGWESDAPSGSRFIDYHEWQGTRDMSAFLATPAAIRFQAERDWPAVRSECHALVVQARQRINTLTRLAPLGPDELAASAQMAAVQLPNHVDCQWLKGRLYDAFRIEVPIYRWNNQPLLRISVQGYNSPGDCDALVKALTALL
jgi:isopenicillin-N epimerase